MNRTLIPRVAEAVDAEMIRQRKDPKCKAIMDLDAERLAIAALHEIADHLETEGWPHPARYLRHKVLGDT